MNIKDCINIIKNCTMLSCEYHIKNKCDYGYEVRENRFECAKEQAIKSLERRIPKTVQGIHKSECVEDIESYGDNAIFGYCPMCGELQSIVWNANTCGACGQVLVWETDFR